MVRSMSSSASMSSAAKNLGGGSSPQSEKETQCPIFRFKHPANEKGDTPEAQSERCLLRCGQEIVKEMHADRTLVMPLYNVMMEHRDRSARQGGFGGQGSYAGKITTLRSIEQDWVCNYLVGVSDLSVADLVACKEAEQDSLSCLLSMDVQMSLAARLPAGLSYKDTMYAFLRKRSQECGRPLRKFKASKGVNSAGMIDWSKGCFQINVDKKEGIVTEVVFALNGHKVDVRAHRLPMQQELRENWCGLSAALVRPPLPPLKLHTLFSERDSQGPYFVQSLAKAKFLNAYVQSVEVEVQAMREEESKKTQLTADSVAKEQLSLIAYKKRQAQSEVARQKAAEHLKAKKARLTINIGNAKDVKIVS